MNKRFSHDIANILSLYSYGLTVMIERIRIRRDKVAATASERHARYGGRCPVDRLLAYAAADLFAEQLCRVDHVDDLVLQLGQIARALGFRYFALVQHANLVHPPRGLIALHDYPPQWEQTFCAAALHRLDPVQIVASRSVAGFAWSALPELLDLSAPQRAMLGDAVDAGLGEGFTIPLHAPGERAGSLSFVTDRTHQLPAGSLQAATLVAHAAYARALRILRPMPGGVGIGLTVRQAQCLALVAQGKTDWETGVILGLRENTVSKYLDAARMRFGVSTRAQLLAVALDDGALRLCDLIYSQ